eukprot:scaffold15095_cov50-Phaeocystis_antarctica.AAC.3
MPSMLLTLDVSKVSGWSNFTASCRVAREVIHSGIGCRVGGERAVGAVVELAARREAARLGRVKGTRTLNMSFMLVTLDVSKFSA